VKEKFKKENSCKLLWLTLFGIIVGKRKMKDIAIAPIEKDGEIN
jgi:hypothetical protein